MNGEWEAIILAELRALIADIEAARQPSNPGLSEAVRQTLRNQGK